MRNDMSSADEDRKKMLQTNKSSAVAPSDGQVSNSCTSQHGRQSGRQGSFGAAIFEMPLSIPMGSPVSP